MLLRGGIDSVVTHGRATRAMSASEELVNASSFRKCRAMVSSGMLQERLLRHTLDFTRVGQVMFSTDYPFHQPSRAAVGQFFDAIPSPADRSKIGS